MQKNPNTELPDRYKNRDYSIEVIVLVEIDDTREYFIARYDFRRERWMDDGWDELTIPILAWWYIPEYIPDTMSDTNKPGEE